ncbi:MAG: GAF domain-containing protein [Ferruginibacter sp.]|nr:GAF domain-containing protein [Ferruginibacter sp.]
MKVAAYLPDEDSRIINLLSYGILDTAEERDFDDLAELVAQVCNCQYAMVTFMDKDRHWFKARRNVEIKESSRDISFCSHTMLQEDVMVVNDTKKDKRFFDSPHVTGGYKVAFYAGVSIISAAGYKIGTVCAMDKKAKMVFTDEQKNALKIIAHQCTALLELRVKNKLIAEQSDALVAEEKKIVQLTLTGHDEEKSFIANELHENFAQTLAATKLYLDFAEQSKELSADFIKKSKANILQIIKDIKALSKSILPSTFQNTNYLGFIQEMLNEYGQQNNKKIAFRHEGKLDCYDSKIGLTLFRIIQYQLKNAHNCGAKKIAIKIKTDTVIRLEFTDDGKNTDSFKPERMMLLHHIETRIAIVKGHVNVGLDKHGHNILEIEIPLIVEQE